MENPSRWIPPILRNPQLGLSEEAQRDEVFRKVRGILNKLTPEKFQPLSDDLLALNLNSKKILLGVIHLIFEKALDEPKYSSMYAQLCRRISKEGGTLESENDYFETLIIRVCRDKFINRSQYSENIINSSPSTGDPNEADEEERRYVAKQKILGNVKFIGELFKLEMLSPAIIHNMLEQLLDRKNRPNPTLEDRMEDMECLSQILRTCGKQLDTEKSKNLIDQYFDIMEQKSNSKKYPLRIRFLLRDVIELRKNDWKPRKIARVEGPVPIQDLSTDEEYIRQQRDIRTRNMEYQNRNSDRNWMDKLPLSLQSMNNYGGTLSMTGLSSSSLITGPYNPVRENTLMSGNNGSYRNHRNNDSRSMNPKFNEGKYNNDGKFQNDSKMNQNKMKHMNRQHDGHQQQNHNHSKDSIPPRFKRNIMTPSTPNSVDDLQMRPSPNSLLFKASGMKPTHQQSTMNQINRSGNGSPSVDNLIPSFNNSLNMNGKGSPPHQTSSNQNGSTNQNSSNVFMNVPAQTKNIANQNNSKQVSSQPTSPQNIQSTNKDQTLVTKQGSVEKPKQKKDKGPNKEETLKKVTHFINEQLLEKKFVERHQTTKIKLENTDLHNNNGHSVNDQTENIKEGTISDENITDEETSIPTFENVLKIYYELKVPEKFTKDAIMKIMNESLDKGDKAHETVVDFMQALHTEKKLSHNQFLDALRGVINSMSEREKTIPKVTTLVASLTAQCILKKIIKLSDVASFTENGQHYPLMLLILQHLNKTIGDDPLIDMFNTSKINLLQSLPECDRSKERLAEILDDRKLSFLQPLLRIESELWRQIQSDPSPNTFYKWIKDNVSSQRYTDTGFIMSLMTVLLRFITQETFPEGSDLSKAPEKHQVDTERKLLDSFSRILNAFLVGHLNLQLIAIYALQVFCFKNQFPKGMLLRWFTTLYELEIVEEEAFLRWKEDITDGQNFPGKGKALFQVNSWLTWLATASSESDEDE